MPECRLPKTPSLDKLKASLEAPHVVVDGVKYLSDRFYLNHVPGDPLPNAQQSCNCGSKQPPPLFSRERLLQSLALKAAIFGTFTMDLDWLTESLPDFCGLEGDVPTLIVHGDKTVKRLRQNKHKYCNVSSNDDSSSEEEPYHPSCSFKDRTNSTGGTPPGGIKAMSTSNLSPTIEVSDDAILKPKPPRKKSRALAKVGKKCHLTFIQSVWKNATNKGDKRVSGEVDNELPNKLSTKRGVHHPKFMILFEKSGSILVVVSTANLVRGRTLEGSWLQRFPPNTQKSPKASAAFRSDLHTSDFGDVLQNFLEKLDESAIPENMKIREFLNCYMDFQLSDLANKFLFHQAQVHLIPVVPGDFSLKTEAMMYGRQRVRAILKRLRTDKTTKLIEHKKDHIIVQPTSFGGKWSQAEMADVARSYHTPSCSSKEYENDCAMMKRMDILWPSRHFLTSLQSNTKVSIEEVENSSIMSNTGNAHLFLSSQCFNSCETSCLSRLRRFRWANPPQCQNMMVPHIKSVCRVTRQPPDYKADGNAKAFLSWFLLTSSCFSHGAQGKRNRFDEATKNTISFTNFELGILFVSRIERSFKNLYVFHPSVCVCHSGHNRSRQKLVHLPIPFALKCEPYLLRRKDGEEDSVMQETPYIHEILPSNRCVGNMMMTPYGIREAKKRRLSP